MAQALVPIQDLGGQLVRVRRSSSSRRSSDRRRSIRGSSSRVGVVLIITEGAGESLRAHMLLDGRTTRLSLSRGPRHRIEALYSEHDFKKFTRASHGDEADADVLIAFGISGELEVEIRGELVNGEDVC